jgi:hypothetical protein
MMTQARGTFEVRMTPEGEDEKVQHVTFRRAGVHKQYRGDLVGTGQGTMLSAVTAVEGSAGYVAMERFSGTLHGRHGTFVLQHGGTMRRGAPHAVIQVVPDSGSGQLEGLSGEMTIEVSDTGHSYEFVYSLEPAR